MKFHTYDPLVRHIVLIRQLSIRNWKDLFEQLKTFSAASVAGWMSWIPMWRLICQQWFLCDWATAVESQWHVSFANFYASTSTHRYSVTSIKWTEVHCRWGNANKNGITIYGRNLLNSSDAQLTLIKCSWSMIDCKKFHITHSSENWISMWHNFQWHIIGLFIQFIVYIFTNRFGIFVLAAYQKWQILQVQCQM